MFLFLFLAGTVRAAEPAEYLYFDPGVRSSGMGSAFTAVADDATAPLFNPAGLARMGTNLTEASVEVGFLPLGRLNDFLSVCQQFPSGDNLGFYLDHYQVNGLSGSDANGLSTGSFNDLNLSFGSAYARDFSYHFKAGVGASFIYENLAGSTAKGFGGVDLGLLCIPSVMEDFVIGASVRHLGGFVSWDNGPTRSLAGDLRVGVSDDFFDKFLLLSYDAEWRGDPAFTLIHHVGGEISPSQFMTLRAGLDDSNPVFGGSVKYLNYNLDYAYELGSSGLGDTQRIGAGFFF